MPTLLYSEGTPRPTVVVAAAVVVANEGSTVLVVEPSSSPPTIDPCPGSAWLMITSCPRAVGPDDVLDDSASLGGVVLLVLDGDDALVLDAVSAAAALPERATSMIARMPNVIR